jgi:hypothetical protein
MQLTNGAIMIPQKTLCCNDEAQQNAISAAFNLVESSKLECQPPMWFWGGLALATFLGFSARSQAKRRGRL